MTQNQKHENYGVYITQNTYTMKWHAFRNEDAERYWTGKDCKTDMAIMFPSARV
jgi:hypothetical protein